MTRPVDEIAAVARPTVRVAASAIAVRVCSNSDGERTVVVSAASVVSDPTVGSVRCGGFASNVFLALYALLIVCGGLALATASPSIVPRGWAVLTLGVLVFTVAPAAVVWAVLSRFVDRDPEGRRGG